MSGIFDWVRGATVEITGLDEGGGRQVLGSGFFVAPGWVLSCAHVVAGAVEPRVVWRGQEFAPLTPPICRPAAADADGTFAFPDTAVLHVPVPDPEPPCVPVNPDP